MRGGIIFRVFNWACFFGHKAFRRHQRKEGNNEGGVILFYSLMDSVHINERIISERVTQNGLNKEMMVNHSFNDDK